MLMFLIACCIIMGTFMFFNFFKRRRYEKAVFGRDGRGVLHGPLTQISAQPKKR